MADYAKTVEVATGASLAALLKAFPSATVRRMICEPGTDGWKVVLDPFDGSQMVNVDQGDDSPVHLVTDVKDPGTDHFGPTRVLVMDEDGEGFTGDTPQEAKRKGVEPELVLVRKDGWTLGCIGHHPDLTEAVNTWNGQWLLAVNLADHRFLQAVDGNFTPETIWDFLDEPEEDDEPGNCEDCGAVLDIAGRCWNQGCPDGRYNLDQKSRRATKKKKVKK